MCGSASHNKRYADLQVVGASCQSGQFQLKMLIKQCGSVGAHTWSQLATVCNDLVDTVTEKAPLDEVNRSLLSHLPISIFIATTDAGPDQIAAKDVIAKEGQFKDDADGT